MGARALIGLAFVMACRGQSTPPPPPVGSAAVVPADAPPKPPAGPQRGVISAGDGHVCARQRDGHVACWGRLAHPSSIQDRNRFVPEDNPVTPVAVTGLAGVAGVEAGGAVRCAWTERGEVWCWGVVDSHDEDRRAPARIAGLSDVVQVAGEATRMMCARRRDGHVACWGEPAWQSATPVQRGDALVSLSKVRVVPEINDAVEIAVGFEHGCARLAIGTVVCWDGPGPDHVRAVSDAYGAISLDGSGGAFYALLPGGRAVGWDLPGQQSRAAVTVPGDATAISVGDEVCVLGREVTCWATGADHPVPRTIPGLIRPIEVSAGGGVTCARTADGHASCWGERGLLGAGETTTAVEPVEVPGLSEVTRVSAAGGTTCARMATGRVACWGDRLATAEHARGAVMPIDDAPVEIAGITDATDVHVTEASACAPLAGGKTVCWGASRLADARLWAKPTPVPALAGGTLLTIDGQPCASRRGAVRCANPSILPRNNIRQIGQLLTSARSRVWQGGFARNAWFCADRARGIECLYAHDSRDGTEVYPERGFELLTDAIDLAPMPGESAMCIVRKPGVVDCPGQGTDRERIPDLDQVIELRGGPDGGFCALRGDGTVRCWNETLRHDLHGSGPLAVPGLTDAVELAPGPDHACVRKKTGTVACWGRRDLLGARDQPTRDAPVVVRGLELADPRGVR